MSDGKDPAIKIFGRTIPLPEGQAPSDPGEVSDPDPNTAVESGKNSCIETTSLEDKGSMVKATEESEQSKQSSSSDHRHRGAETRTGLKLEQQQGEADEEKILKKPDKILPCPRCNSLDTKFCYYNNYNVNQPRHFCKNCQRYWTAGGTMRNVPVGAGRRKTKHPPSLYRQIMVPSEEMPCVSLDANDSAHHQAHSGGLKGNGAGPLCDSIVSNLGDQKTGKGEEPMCSSLNQVEIDCVGTADHEEQFEMPGCSNGAPPPLHHLTPLVFPWWNNPTAMGAGWCSPELYGQNTPLWPPSPILPIPFMPTSYWGCMPGWLNVGWNAPMVGSYGQVLPSSATGNGECSPNGSPTLGKHSRDNGLEGEERKEKSLWIPKTLRIDDPDEAAKSSIWATLGIKPDGSITKGGMLKAFHSKTESKDRRTGATQILCANPAALCRSQTFQEST